MPTVLEVIKSTTGFFEKHGIDSPRLNAEHIVAHTLGKKKRLDLYLEFDRPLGESELAPMRGLVRSRSRGVPLQHLIGTVEFFGREFLCDARALVPRPETEQLVELVLESKIQSPKSKILDVGTGSGVIAITLALELPGSEVHSIDASPDALALATENAGRLGAHVQFGQADILPPGSGSFDVIVANLPYIPSAAIPGLSREVRHDPLKALDGGADGLDLVRRLIEKGHDRLPEGGRIFLEVGHDQAGQVSEVFARHGYRDIAVSNDLQGVARFVAGSR